MGELTSADRSCIQRAGITTRVSVGNIQQPGRFSATDSLSPDRWGITKDEKRGFQWLRKACDQLITSPDQPSGLRDVSHGPLPVSALAPRER